MSPAEAVAVLGLYGSAFGPSSAPESYQPEIVTDEVLSHLVVVIGFAQRRSTRPVRV
jgi:hypothetical protein